MKKVQEVQERKRTEGSDFSRIPKIQSLKVKELGDGKFMYMNQEFVRVGNHIEITKYIMENCSEKSKTKIRRGRRSNTVKILLKNDAPKKLHGETIIDEILREGMLSCDTAEVVNYCKNDRIKRIKDYPSSKPKGDRGIILVTMLNNAQFRAQTNSSFIHLTLGTRRGLGVTNARNTSMVGREDTTRKLFVLENDAGPMPSKLIFQLDKWVARQFTDYQVHQVEFDLPTLSEYYDFESKRKASAGYCELSEETNKEVIQLVKECKGRLISISNSLTPKKNQSAGITLKRLFERLDLAEKMMQRGVTPASGHMGPSRLVIKYKYELGLMADFIDMYSNYENNYNQLNLDLDKYQTKLRAFWSDSQFKVCLDRLLMHPGIEFIKGGYDTQICAIGCDTVSGSFGSLMNHLKLDLHYVPPDMKDNLELIYEEYPELRERVYSELDFSKFDSTIHHILILMCTAYMNVVPYEVDHNEGIPTIKEEMLIYLSSVSTTFNTYKFAFVPYLEKVIYFMGRVPSGSLSTSPLDSIAQMILRDMFMEDLIEEHISQGEIEVARKLFIVKNFLLVALIYGDDRTEGVPRDLYDLIGLHPFKDWVEKNAGMIIKYIKPPRVDGEVQFHIFPDAIGRVEFEKRGQFYVTLSKIDSPTFLKTQMVMVVADGVEIGILPYRPTEDLLAKMASSLSALSNPIKYLCSLASLLYLSVGNLTAFFIILNQYEIFVNKLQMPERIVHMRMRMFQEQFDADSSAMRTLPNSMRKILLQGLCGRIPTWKEVANKHDLRKPLLKKEPRNFPDVILNPTTNQKVHYTAPDYIQIMNEFDQLIMSRS